MSEQELKTAIGRVVEAIDALDQDDSESREDLKALATKLQARLDRRQSDVATEEPIGADNDNAVLEMVERYESRHPQITLMLNDIMTRLASMGI